MSTKAAVSTLAVTAALAVAGTASGSPGAASLPSADGASIYMVSPRDGTTVVTKIRGSNRTAEATRQLRGSFQIPAVAGVKGGLSGDGRTLVLAGHPAANVSRFAILDTETMRVRRMLTLRGTYGFDALSPDASTLYVIRFLSADGSHYAVQALDVNDAKPVAKTLVEKGEPGEAMTGQPLTRTTSPDGNWVYTLYDGTSGVPFVHALSTVDKYTVCIDLDALEGRRDLASLGLELSPRSHTLAVTAAHGPLALIDTASFEVRTPPKAPKSESQAAPVPEQRHDKSTLWWLVIGAAGLGLAAAGAAAKRLQKRPNPTQT
jgi:hypothetical protein